MRTFALALVAACSIGNQRPSALPPVSRDPDLMPSTTLEHQDPGADTSHNPVLSRSESHYRDPNDAGPLGCRMLACSVGGGGGDASMLLVLAAIAHTLRRRARG